MNVLVFGAGALGSLVGGLLAQEHDVSLYGRKPHMTAVAQQGLTITGKTELKVTPHACYDFAELSTPDLLILTVKAYDTSAAIEEARSIIGPGTLVFSLQNGLDNIERIMSSIGNQGVIGGVTCHGVTFVDNGHVHHAGTGDTVIGVPRGAKTTDEELQRVASVLTEAGFPTRTTDNLQGETWAKIIVNACINPLTSIIGMPNGALVDNDELFSLMEAIYNEAMALVETIGVTLPKQDPWDKTLTVVQLTNENRSSMLQDIQREKLTEIDAINGQIVAAGTRHGVPTPVNMTMVNLVHALECKLGLRDEC